MKYLKSFENKKNGKYWLLPTDDRLLPSLKKIKCPVKRIEQFLDNITMRKNKYCFICYSNYGNIDSVFEWGWNPFKGNLFDSTSEELGYRFSGVVNLKDEEKLQLVVTKYNI